MQPIRREHALGAHEAAHLKTALLCQGLRPVEAVLASFGRQVRPPMRVRSGSCGGLDVILPGGTYVNCPVHEDYAATSPFRLRNVEGQSEDLGTNQLVLEHDDGRTWPVQLLPVPQYYSQVDQRGRPLSQLGQLCGDRLGIGLTNDCTYWQRPAKRCKFCSIGLNLGTEQRRKLEAEIVEVVDAAFADSVAPARHVLLGGGTPLGTDAGADAIAEAARAIRQRHDVSIYAMVAAPTDLTAIERLAEAGVDEVGMNLELVDPQFAARLIPGKHDELGLDHYLRALEQAVVHFGRLATRSILVVGLEPMEATLKGVELLAARGVMPILSPFRPMKGTDLAHLQPPPLAMLWETLLGAREIATRYDVPLGPLCIPCQGNTLTVPEHPEYRFY